MAGKRKQLAIPKKRARNIARQNSTFIDQIRAAGMRARIVANQPTYNRQYRHVQAALAQEDAYLEMELGWMGRCLRWLIGLLMLPVCLITTYTLANQFADETLNQQFWRSEEFILFSTGAASMLLLFSLGIFHKIFLFLYVLGHELTHALLVVLHRGKVSDMKVSIKGGYIATNKSNILISLSPYFIPYWSVAWIALYGFLSWNDTFRQYADHLFYAGIGATWTFHLWWTLWMIPRDQPDLKENDTFFSLVFIYLANIIALSIMLCMSSPTMTFTSFFATWWVNAENFLRFIIELWARF